MKKDEGPLPKELSREKAKRRYMKSGFQNTEAAIRAVLGKARGNNKNGGSPFAYEPIERWVRPDGTFASGAGDPRTHVQRVIAFDPIGFLIASMEGMALPQASEDGASIVYKVPVHEARMIAAGYLALFQIDAIKYKKYTMGSDVLNSPYQLALHRAAQKAEMIDDTKESGYSEEGEN